LTFKNKKVFLFLSFVLILAVAFPSSVTLPALASAGASDVAPQNQDQAESQTQTDSEPQAQGPVQAETSLIAISDIGCKPDSIKNLKNIAVQDLPVISAGDIRYKCNAQDLKRFWDNIDVKHGVYGNHDVETGSKAFVKNLFGLGPLGWFTWKERGWNVGIIGMNQYANYDVGSAQNIFTAAALDRYQNNPAIDWILVVFHEPIRTPELDHGPNDKFKRIYEPLFQKYDKVVVLEAHNHGIWWGKNNDVNQIGCGGGGYGGDTFGGEINGFDYVSVKPGFCLMDFFPDEVSVKHIGTDGTSVLKQSSLTK